MVVSRTPVRISFLGGGTDYPAHFREFGGQTIGVAIDKYSYVTVNHLAELFEHKIRVSYSQLELVRSIDEIRHPAARECLRYLGFDKGVEINYVGDLPARTGLGSSSSFTVALLHALHAYRNEMVSHARLAQEAVYVEQELIGERVGVQDQYTCAHGGLVHLRFSQQGAVEVRPVPLPQVRLEELQDNLMLMYTGMCRNAHDVLEEQMQRTRQGALAKDLGYLSDLVDECLTLLTSTRPMADFGHLLHDAWQIKRSFSSATSNPQIDACYEAARAAGAWGGKLLGAGGGGFLLLAAPPELQARVEEALRLPRVDFSFDHEGSTIQFYRPSPSQRARKSQPVAAV